MATPLALEEETVDKIKHIVPWKSRQEFLKLYNDVFCEDESLQRLALKRINTWKSRVGSRISVAIENTGSLLQSILDHKVAVREQCLVEQEYTLRSAYGLAIVRFVNLVTEKKQNKRIAQPVHSLAREFGIPDWIVRIRHDSTHQTLPGLDALATAASWALHFLKEEFWNCQTHDDAPSLPPRRLGKAKLRRKIQQALHTYQKLWLKEIESEEGDPKITTTVQLLKEYMKENRFVFAKCMMEDGCLIPTTEQLKALGIDLEDITQQPHPCVPPSLVNMWKPVLCMLHAIAVLPILVKLLTFSLSEEDSVRNHLMTGWLVLILENSGKVSGEKTKAKRPIFSGMFLPRRLLLSACLENVNKFTIHLLKYVINREDLGDSAYLKLSTLLSVAASAGDLTLKDSGDEEEEESGYTVQDVKEASFCQSSVDQPLPDVENVQAGIGEGKTGWKICTDVVDWSRVPLGVVPSLLVEEGDEEEEDAEDLEGKEAERAGVDDDEEDEESRGVRDWKTSRKRPVEEEGDVEEENRSNTKRSTYFVNDTELL